MSTHATATDSTAAADDYVDTTADARLDVRATSQSDSETAADSGTSADSLTAAEAVAAAPAPFDATATRRLPNTTDEGNEVVR